MLDPKARVTWANASWAQKAVALGLPLLLLCFSGANFYRGLRSLDSLDKIQGTVVESSLLRDNGRTRSFISTFCLRNHNALFGVYQGQNRAEAEALVARVAPQSFVTVYYDAAAFHEDGITLHVYQIDEGTQIVYSIQASRSFDLFMGIAFLLIDTILVVWLYWSMRSKTQTT